MQRFLLVAGCVLAFAASGLQSGPGDVIETIDDYIDQWERTDRLNGAVLIARGEDVLYARGVGYADIEKRIPNTATTRFKLASLTKQFTAIMILQLEREGLVSRQDAITRHIPFYRKDTGDRITIDHLLQHTSGIPDYVRNQLMPPTDTPYDRDYMITEFMSGDLEFDPGERYSYSNSGYFLLGAIIENVTGSSYEENLRERILAPLSMSDTGIYKTGETATELARGYVKTYAGYEPKGVKHPQHSLGSGNAYSTVEDMFRWVRALREATLLPSGYRDMLVWPHHESNQNLGHSYLWNIRSIRLSRDDEPVELREFNGWSGSFNTGVQWFPEDDLVVIVFSNRAGVDLIGMSIGIAQIVQGKPFRMPRRMAFDELAALAYREGAERALEHYENIREHHEDEYDFMALDYDLNRLGYELLNNGEPDRALAVLRLNAAIFPENSNAWDSLGDACSASGELVAAISNYGRSFALDPGNDHARERLRQITADRFTCDYMGEQPPGRDPAVFARGVVSTEQGEICLRISPDGAEICFMQLSGNHPRIMISRSTPDGWTEPAPASFSGQYHDGQPYYSPDGQTLYWISNRPLPPSWSGPRPALDSREAMHVWKVTRIGSE